MGNKKNRIQKKNKKLRKNKKPSVRNIMPYSTAKRVVLSIQRLIDNIQSQILKDEIFDSVAFFQDLEKISELIQVLDSNGYKNIIPSEIIEKLIAYLCLLYYAYNSTNEKVENHYDEQVESYYDEQVESYYDEQVEYCYDEQVESYYDEQAKTKVFPKINIKKNIKNNIQRDSNSDFSPWDSDTSTSQIFG